MMLAAIVALCRAQHEEADEGAEDQVRRGRRATAGASACPQGTERLARCAYAGQGVRAQKPWISDQVTSIVKELSAGKATATDEAGSGPEQAVTEKQPAEEAAAPTAAVEEQKASPAGESEPKVAETGSLVVEGVALEGLWLSSAGKAMLVCKGRTVTFVSSGKTYALTLSEGGVCQMDGWTLVPGQSNASTLRWEQGNEVITWEFEGSVDEAPPIGTDQPVATSKQACGLGLALARMTDFVVIPIPAVVCVGAGASPGPVRDATATRSKRKRNSVDYVAMNRRMKGLGSGGGIGGGGGGGGATGGGGSGGGGGGDSAGLLSLMQAHNDDDDDDGDVDAKELEMAEKRRKLAEKPLVDATAVAAAGRSLEVVKGDPAMITVGSSHFSCFSLNPGSGVRLTWST
eukprot:COSAG02_NODE_275_length_26232_cov_85.210424_17_plen_403_part_00